MSKKVLIIDDDPNHQQIYSDILSNSGFEVFSATDPTKGLYLAQNNKPNLILLDIMLPGSMNGMELLSQIKGNSELAEIPVVALTNLDTEKESALAAGAIDYIVKSNFTPHEVVDMVKQHAK